MSEPVVPEKRTEFPVIEKLVIRDGSLLFNNQETNTQIELKLTQAEAGIQKRDPHGLILKDFHQTGGTKKVPDNRAIAQ